MDHAGPGHRPAAENQLVREGHLLLLRRAELAQGAQGVPTRIRQVRREAALAADPASQPEPTGEPTGYLGALDPFATSRPTRPSKAEGTGLD